ncbi:MAG TPA: hypothetical protein DIT13_14105 [Verrucomicrobiales bacterium]|nr:hypothetical protein [Verrucomicrobiales bacterium]HRJ10894.1 hypothetical protein [Prosthecobacter sp.]HRK16888.1 hypothetical protein [Prosthecobacter sp.]
MIHRPILVLFSAALAVQAADFKKDIQPILEKHCYECHSEKTGKQKAGYVFDDLETLKLDINPKGAIVPGKPAESHVFVVVSDPNHEAHMPPKGNLSDREISKLRDWITAGAHLTPEAAATAAAPAKPAVLDWTNFEGRTIKAGFVRLDGENVVLKMASGQEIPYPLAKLNEASRKQAQDSAAQ